VTIGLALTTLAPFIMGAVLTPHESAQAWGRVETPDQFLTGIEDRAGNFACRILEENTHVLGKRKEGTVPPLTKWQRLNDSASDIHSGAQSVEPQLFNPSLDREDKEEFKFEAPDRVFF